jgi:hypothetical protein
MRAKAQAREGKFDFMRMRLLYFRGQHQGGKDDA